MVRCEWWEVRMNYAVHSRQDRPLAEHVPTGPPICFL